MNRRKRAIIATGIGVATTIGGYEFADMLGMADGFVKDVKTCAKPLGEQGVKAAVIIDNCSPYTDEFKKEIMTSSNGSRQIVYSLPTSAEFTAAHMPDALHKEARGRDLEWVMGGIGGAIMALGMYALSRPYESNRQPS